GCRLGLGLDGRLGLRCRLGVGVGVGIRLGVSLDPGLHGLGVRLAQARLLLRLRRSVLVLGVELGLRDGVVECLGLGVGLRRLVLGLGRDRDGLGALVVGAGLGGGLALLEDAAGGALVVHRDVVLGGHLGVLRAAVALGVVEIVT